MPLHIQYTRYEINLTSAHPPHRYNAKQLWSKGFKGEGVRVAVFDTGIDKNHKSFNHIDDRSNWTDEDTLEVHQASLSSSSSSSSSSYSYSYSYPSSSCFCCCSSFY